MMDDSNKCEEYSHIGKKLIMIKKTIDNYNINKALSLNMDNKLYHVLKRNFNEDTYEYEFIQYTMMNHMVFNKSFVNKICIHPDHHFVYNTDYSYYLKTIGVTEENISEDASVIRNYELNPNVKVKVPIRVTKLWLYDHTRYYRGQIHSSEEDIDTLINNIIGNNDHNSIEYKEYDIDDVTKLSDLLRKVLGEHYTYEYVQYAGADAPIILDGMNIYKQYFKSDLSNDEEFKRGDFFRFNVFYIPRVYIEDSTIVPCHGYLTLQIIDNRIYFMFTNIHCVALTHIKGVYYNNNIHQDYMYFKNQSCSIENTFKYITTVFDIFRLAWRMSFLNPYPYMVIRNPYILLNNNYKAIYEEDSESYITKTKCIIQKYIDEFCDLDILKYHIPQKIENQDT